MAGFIGRKVTLTWGGAAVAGVREKGLTLNGEPINVSDGASDGWQELLTEAGENSVEVSLSGVTKDDVLRAAWFSGNRTEAVVISWPLAGGSLSGTFMISAYSEGQPYQDAATFECTLMSTGEVTYTPAT